MHRSLIITKCATLLPNVNVLVILDYLSGSTKEQNVQNDDNKMNNNKTFFKF